MKKYWFAFCAFAFLIMAAGCSSIDQEVTSSELPASSISEPTSDLPESQGKMDEEKVVELFASVAETVQRETVDVKISYKEIEDIYKKHPDNVTISNLYACCVSYDYLWFKPLMNDESYQTMAEDEAAKIDPSYSGPYADIIIAHAKRVLGDDYSDKRESVTIAQDKYDSLTTQDKALIIKYIYERYDYYDTTEGKETGDKYSDQIWQEVKDKYGLTEAQVTLVWIDTEATKYYNQNYVEKSGTAPAPSSSADQDIPSDAISLYFGGDDILCGTTKDNYSNLIDCIVKEDEYGFNEMFLLGQAFTVPSNTKALVLERKLTQSKVRICEGTYINEIAWVAREATEN